MFLHVVICVCVLLPGGCSIHCVTAAVCRCTPPSVYWKKRRFMVLLEDHRRSKVKEKTVYLDMCKKPFMQQNSDFVCSHKIKEEEEHMVTWLNFLIVWIFLSVISSFLNNYTNRKRWQCTKKVMQIWMYFLLVCKHYVQVMEKRCRSSNELEWNLTWPQLILWYLCRCTLPRVIIPTQKRSYRDFYYRV